MYRVPEKKIPVNSIPLPAKLIHTVKKSKNHQNPFVHLYGNFR